MVGRIVINSVQAENTGMWAFLLDVTLQAKPFLRPTFSCPNTHTHTLSPGVSVSNVTKLREREIVHRWPDFKPRFTNKRFLSFSLSLYIYNYIFMFQNNCFRLQRNTPPQKKIFLFTKKKWKWIFSIFFKITLSVKIYLYTTWACGWKILFFSF